MPTSTDLEQTGRDANILNNYFDGAPALLPEQEYGRLGQLLLRLVNEGGGGTTIKYGGRVDSVADLPETGETNQFYFVGLETADNWDEYIWAVPAEGETGHWDRLGSVSIVIDDHLDANSTNPVQNRIVTAALATVNNTGDIYIGSQLVRKVLSQAEYDALVTKDPKVEYLILEETEGA